MQPGVIYLNVGVVIIQNVYKVLIYYNYKEIKMGVYRHLKENKNLYVASLNTLAAGSSFYFGSKCLAAGEYTRAVIMGAFYIANSVSGLVKSTRLIFD